MEMEIELPEGISLEQLYDPEFDLSEEQLLYIEMQYSSTTTTAEPTICFTLLVADAKSPTKANLGDAGWDLYALEDTKLLPGQNVAVRTGVAFRIPLGYYGKLEARSGLALKYGVELDGGVIDSGYRGEIVVIMACKSEPGYEIKAGDKIAQIIFQKCHLQPIKMISVHEFTQDSTERGNQGFGSSDSQKPLPTQNKPASLQRQWNSPAKFQAFLENKN